IKLAPKVPELHVDLASVFNRSCNYPGTISECEIDITQAPNNPYAWREAGSAYEMLGQTDKAIAAYKRYVALAPKAADRKQFDQAIKELEADLKSGKPLT